MEIYTTWPQAGILNFLLPFGNIKLMSDTGPGRGMICDDAPLLEVCASQGCQPTTPGVPSQGLMKRNEKKWNKKNVKKWWNEICVWGKRKKPREKPTQIPFCLPRNPHGVTETRTRYPSGGWLCFTTLFTISGHQRRLLHWAWKVWQIFFRGSNSGLRFFYVP